MAASRTAMAMLGAVSSSKPERVANSWAAFSRALTLSRVEGTVIEARLVVGSGNRITCSRRGREFRGFYGDEGQCAWRLPGMSRIGRFKVRGSWFEVGEGG